MISCKTFDEIVILRQGGIVLSQIMKELMGAVKPGISTLDLDNLARKLIDQAGARSAFLGYRGYPAALCTSVNDEVVHSIPRADQVLKEGDIVGLDLGIEYKGLFTDMTRTVGVGKISEEVKYLIQTTKEALDEGLKQVRNGATTGDIGFAIQKYVEKRGFGVVRDLIGHGVGYSIHEEPPVPNFGLPKTGVKLITGMVLAIEPMVNQGTFRVKTAEDGWTMVTLDGKLSAHWEDTIVVTEKGYEILTR